VKYRNPYQASLDGNTVEMPIEQAAFSETNVRYQASLTFINSRISELTLAIAPVS
jgi:flagellar basal-body rod protein FlgB